MASKVCGGELIVGKSLFSAAQTQYTEASSYLLLFYLSLGYLPKAGEKEKEPALKCRALCVLVYQKCPYTRRINPDNSSDSSLPPVLARVD